jgi:uncharacterized protein (TIGR02757 family)
MTSKTHHLTLVKESLETLRASYGPSYLPSDPLLFLHTYDDPRDQEVVGFLAALFAYGHVLQIKRNLRNVLAPFPDSIARAIRKGSIADWRSTYEGFTYRFQQSDDLVMLLWLLKRVLKDFGSIEASFLPFFRAGEEALHPLRPALTGWVRFLRETLRTYPGWRDNGTHRGIHHLLADPATGSPCKRWNLYLRWMVRGPDGLDLGLWKCVQPRHLVLPLDTHTARICRYLRLTRRATPSWAMAEEITQVLRNLDPDDPVRYDFSIARLGILARCTKGMDRTRCVDCELTRICHAEDDRSVGTRLPVSRQRGTMVP